MSSSHMLVPLTPVKYQKLKLVDMSWNRINQDLKPKDEFCGDNLYFQSSGVEYFAAMNESLLN